MIANHTDIISLLANVKKVGSGKWKAQCPVHLGESQSLAITLKSDGKYLLFCHAHQCKYENIMSALGIERSLPSEPRMNGRVSYQYRDANGSSLMKVDRITENGKKRFLPSHEVDGQTVHKDPPGLLPLYSLPSLADADQVFVVEGEKCCDLLNQLELVCTTSSHGSKSAKRTDWEPLRGKSVAILPDNDEAGTGYSKAVTSILMGLGCTVKVVNLPGLNHGEDVEQWLDRLGEAIDPAGALEEMVINAEPVRRPGVRLIRGSHVIKKKTEWLWRNWLPLNNVTNLVGDGDMGKSSLAQAIAAIVTAGGKMPGVDGNYVKKGSVIFLDNENEHSLIVERVQAAGGDVNNIAIFDSIVRSDLEEGFFCINSDLNILSKAIEQFEGEPDTPDVSLVIVDVLGSYISQETDTHKDDAVRRLMMRLDTFAKYHHISVVCLRHFNKSSSSASNRGQGATAFRNSVRSQIYVVPDPDDGDRDNPRRLVICEKHNLCKKPKGVGFRFGENEDGDITVIFDDRPVEQTADEILGDPNKSKIQRDDAEAWIKERLSDGPVPSKELKLEIDECMDFSWRTFRRAANVVGVKKRSVTGASGKVEHWECYLPSSEREDK